MQKVYYNLDTRLQLNLAKNVKTFIYKKEQDSTGPYPYKQATSFIDDPDTFFNIEIYKKHILLLVDNLYFNKPKKTKTIFISFSSNIILFISLLLYQKTTTMELGTTSCFGLLHDCWKRYNEHKP
jgi:hypothetical protein